MINNRIIINEQGEIISPSGSMVDQSSLILKKIETAFGSFSELQNHFNSRDSLILMKFEGQIHFFGISINKNEMVIFQIEHLLDFKKLEEKIPKFVFNLIKNERPSVKSLISRKLAHDIANPLTAISMNLEFIDDTISPDKLTKEDFDLLKDSLEGSINSTNNIRDILEEFRKNEVQIPEFNYCMLNETIEFVLYFIAHSIEENIIISWKKIEDLKIGISEVSFWRSLTSLLQNSLEAIDGKPNGLINISCYKLPNDLEIEIKDNGIGMEETVKYRVTKPLFTTKKGHLGLGLSIVDQLIMDTDGDLAIFGNAEHTKITWKIPIYKNDRQLD